MYDPIMRVLTVLEILQAREHVSGAELARRLEVNPRTVQRYIARLQDLCIPVESTRGVGGAYRLKPGFRLPPMMFTDEEAFALTLGLRALRHLGLAAFAPATEGAAAKLGRVLPDLLRESAAAVEEVVAVEPGPWVIFTSAESLIRLCTAVRTRRPVSFHYESHDRSSSRREIEPYGIVHMDGRWYVIGRCRMRQALRTFRLDRVSELEVSDETFERPAGFDAKAYLQRSMPFVQAGFSIEVWLDLPIENARSHFALHRVMMEDDNGGTTLRCGRENLEPFAAMLLSLGCSIVVRQPRELRDAFERLAARAAQAARGGEKPYAALSVSS
ncbi:MAG: YafY family transcriptional regulator [Terriglobia bacterium]|nr:MAG: YafY family transcriptional regulator [Terriglobia bacterium]